MLHHRAVQIQLIRYQNRAEVRPSLFRNDPIGFVFVGGVPILPNISCKEKKIICGQKRSIPPNLYFKKSRRIASLF